MPNPCGGVHMPSFPCRECDRARSLKAASQHEAPKPDVDAPETKLDLSKGAPETVRYYDDGSKSVGPLTRAEISRRQREKDPEAYKKWNRERMRRKRSKEAGDG